jgi:hypothetical protein
MKKMIKFLSACTIIFLLLTSCGDRGPVGPEGPQGPPGPEVIPTSFEFEADLLLSNGFEFFRDIPSQIEVFESDVMLAYVLEDIDDGLEVWRKLPVTEFNSSGTLLLDFDFTFVDIRIFLDANYNLGFADQFEGLLIRAVHVPAAFLSNSVATVQSVKKAETIGELETILGTNVKKLDSK